MELLCAKKGISKYWKNNSQYSSYLLLTKAIGTLQCFWIYKPLNADDKRGAVF